MNETPMLFPIAPGEFWKQIRLTVEEVVNEKLNSPTSFISSSRLQEKPLLKVVEVCEIFQVSKPTLYEWMRLKKINSFKIRSRRYFNRCDIEDLLNQTKNC